MYSVFSEVLKLASWAPLCTANVQQGLRKYCVLRWHQYGDGQRILTLPHASA